MVTVVGQKDGVIGAHVDAVRVPEHTLSSGAHEVASAIEYHDRVRAAIEGVDIVPPIDADRGDIAAIPAVGPFRPTILSLIGEIAASHDAAHVRLPPRI